MNPKVKKGIDIALTVLVVILFVLGILMVIIAFSSSNDNNKLGNVLGYTPVQILTDSMTPEIPVGALVLLKEVEDSSTLKVGDIITYTFLNAGQYDLNTHKIVKIDEEAPGIYKFTTQGVKEGLPEDAPIYVTSIRGKVVATIPVLGSVLGFLKSFLVFGLVIVLPLFLFFAYRVYVLVKVINELKKEKNPKAGSDYENLLKQVEELKSKLNEKEQKE